MRIAWSRTATDQLIEIHNFIALDKPDAARGAAQRIKESVRLLAEHTHVGRSGREPGTREWAIPGTPFIIIYRVESDRLWVAAILHGARRRPS
jgi:plasmid stabilization system protein ParE